MIKSTQDYQISQIFDIESKVKYVIPKFQREYIWRKEHWEDLFYDLSENEKGHFLGTIICIDVGKDALETKPLELIDGQQRLTALSLLYAVIFEKLSQEGKEDETFITEKTNLKNRLIQKGTKDELKIELSHQNSNFDDYKAILGEIGLIDISSRPSHLGNRRLYKTFQYFRKRISDYNYKELIEILERVNSTWLVKIEVDSHADAFMLFESLNDRGEPLSPIDIIKNKVLSEVEKKGEISLYEAYNKWINMIENLPDYSIQERFLRHYYNAFRYSDSIRIKGITRATRSKLIKIYETLIEKNVEFIFKELVGKSEIYRKFVMPEYLESQNKYSKSLIDLLHIGSAPAYAFLLYLFEKHSKNTVLLKDSINFLVKYFVRRNLTDFPATRDLDIIFVDLINEFEKNKDNSKFDIFFNFLTRPERFANLARFKEKLKGDIYEDNTAVTRFILCKLEEENQTKETFTNLWERDNSARYIWTIEHIFPRGKNIPQEWVDMVAKGDGCLAQEFQMQWVDKIGNLTLTGYNPNLSDFSFEKKRDRKNKIGKYIGYRNGLYLNKFLVNKQSWTIDHISKRTNGLVDEALKLFKIKGE